MNAIGDRHLAMLAARRCCRCGRLLYENPQFLASMLDIAVTQRSQGACLTGTHSRIIDGMQAPQTCGQCHWTDSVHRTSSARGKTK